ncbi:hypothetical protein HRbin34_00191 [bacterium HR34]|nr:hypothetical protein HRbin34_00191 [bacterium HR34]
MQIQNLKKLYNAIQPDKTWKESQKNFILSTLDIQFSNQYNYSNNFISAISKILSFKNHPVLTSEVVVSLLALIFLFGAYLSLPGDPLYTVKENVIEKVSIPPENELALLEAKLSEIERAVQENKTQNIKPAVEKVVQTVAKVNPQDIAKKVKENHQIIEDVREVRVKVQRLSALGVDGELQKVEDTLKDIVKAQIDYLETRSFTKEQMEILKEAIEHYRNGEYDAAMQKILSITN